jgi:hypothetical protein
MRLLFITLFVLGCGSPGPMTTKSEIGGPCSGNNDCVTGGSCIIKVGWPDNYCTVRPCTVAGGECGTNADCTGGHAVGGELCLKKCSSKNDCRTGYNCCPDLNNVNVCVPPGQGAIGC